MSPFKRAAIELQPTTASSNSQGRLYLNCPFHQKDEAKEKGAHWDQQARKWYVPVGKNPWNFKKWLSQEACEKIRRYPEVVELGCGIQGVKNNDGVLSLKKADIAPDDVLFINRGETAQGHCWGCGKHGLCESICIQECPSDHPSMDDDAYSYDYDAPSAPWKEFVNAQFCSGGCNCMSKVFPALLRGFRWWLDNREPNTALVVHTYNDKEKDYWFRHIIGNEDMYFALESDGWEHDAGWGEGNCVFDPDKKHNKKQRTKY